MTTLASTPSSSAQNRSYDLVDDHSETGMQISVEPRAEEGPELLTAVYSSSTAYFDIDDLAPSLIGSYPTGSESLSERGRLSELPPFSHGPEPTVLYVEVQQLPLAQINFLEMKGSVLGLRRSLSPHGKSDSTGFRASPNPSLDISDAVQSLKVHLRRSDDEIFEDGIENAFSRGLERLLAEFDDAVIRGLGLLVRRREVHEGVLAEALRCLGVVADSSTHASRLAFLESMLEHQSPIVRDAAVVGLSYLGDQASISKLKKARDHETIENLRADIVDVIEALANP